MKLQNTDWMDYDMAPKQHFVHSKWYQIYPQRKACPPATGYPRFRFGIEGEVMEPMCCMCPNENKFLTMSTVETKIGNQADSARILKIFV